MSPFNPRNKSKKWRDPDKQVFGHTRDEQEPREKVNNKGLLKFDPVLHLDRYEKQIKQDIEAAKAASVGRLPARRQSELPRVGVSELVQSERKMQNFSPRQGSLLASPRGTLEPGKNKAILV